MNEKLVCPTAVHADMVWKKTPYRLCEHCHRARLAWDMLAPPVPSTQERKIFSSVSEYKTVASSVCLTAYGQRMLAWLKPCPGQLHSSAPGSALAAGSLLLCSDSSFCRLRLCNAVHTGLGLLEMAFEKE